MTLKRQIKQYMIIQSIHNYLNNRNKENDYLCQVLEDQVNKVKIQKI